jgi:hypothetical protein
MAKKYRKHHKPKDAKEQILKLFYRTELRPNEEFIDNRDRIIAEELGIHLFIVQKILLKESENHIKRIKIKYNHETLNKKRIKNII